jgi:hypothetical protein
VAGIPFAVMRKFRDGNGGALTTVVVYNAFFALFPLLLVVVTVLGFLLGRDSGFQQCLLGSAAAEFPIIGYQVRDNFHGLRGSGVGLVVGLVAFAWGARGLTQVTQHAMAEIWNIPSRQRPGLLARQVRVCCCWWSSPLGWPRPRRACWNGCAVRRLVLVLAVGWGRAVGSVGPVLVRRAGWLTGGCRGWAG